MNPFFMFLVTLCAVWVYWDATGNRIGKTDAKGLFNLPAGAWAVCTLLLWIVAFPAYLLKRASLISIANEKPVDVKMRVFKAIVIFLLGMLWIMTASYLEYLKKVNQVM